MNPPQPPAPQPSRSVLVTLAATIIPILVCSGLGYVAIQIIRGPYVDQVVWKYDDFYFAGGTSGPWQLCADSTLPQNIVVERVEDRRKIKLSTITWQSAKEMSTKEPSRLSNDEDLVEMLDETGYGSSYLTVKFQYGIFKSLTAHGVRIHNTANGQSRPLPKWSDVEIVFGKPKSIEKSRHYVHWGR